jgi:hypothetical protein
MASATTAAKKPTAIKYASGSNKRMPTIAGIPLRRTMAAADAPRAPQMNPMATDRRIGARMARITWPARAPSAIRRPISRVRCATV